MKRIKAKKEKKEVKKKPNSIKKIWNFIWESNSIWSWIADLILLYLLINFILFPAVGLIAGSSLPSVIVESESMVHAGNFNEWWNNFGSWYENHNITKQETAKWSFHNGINKGDIIIVSGRNKESFKVGDVIVFDAGQAKPIIHRIIRISDSISTKGDNNIEQLSVEKNISYNKIIGKAVFKIPKMGWAKLIFVETLKGLFK